MKKISKGVFMSVAGGVVLLLQAFGLKIDAPYVNEIIEALCAVLIVLGIVTVTSASDTGDGDGQSDKIEGGESAADKNADTDKDKDTDGDGKADGN